MEDASGQHFSDGSSMTKTLSKWKIYEFKWFINGSIMIINPPLKTLDLSTMFWFLFEIS